MTWLNSTLQDGGLLTDGVIQEIARTIKSRAVIVVIMTRVTLKARVSWIWRSPLRSEKRIARFALEAGRAIVVPLLSVDEDSPQLPDWDFQ